jgi:predicted AlkP superfamily pyrophosphatase or phosphodiesterase
MKYTQLDIAPTISSLLGFEIPDKDGREIEEIRVYCEDKNIDQILLIVVDGVGASLSLAPRITTPNIGTILTGYTPEHHRLYEAADTFYTPVKSILEIASDNGIKSGIVIELLGAKAMSNRVDLAMGVENLHGIIDYDRRITKLALKAFDLEGIQLMMVHLRAVDNCVHHYAKAWDDIIFSAQTIDQNCATFCSGLHKPTLILVTSDHPVHVEKWAYLEDGNLDVPLVVGYVSPASDN